MCPSMAKVISIARGAPVSAAQPEVKAPSLRSADVRDAALTLFAERGYHATSMKDIAAALGLQAPSLYNHVASKQVILRDVMVDTMDALLRAVNGAIATTDDPIEKLRRATQAHVRFHAVHRREVRVGNHEIPALEEPQRTAVVDLRRKYSHLFQQMIDRGLAAGVFDCRSSTLAAYAILQMGIGVSMWFREDGELTEEAVALQYGDIALRIVGANAATREERQPKKAVTKKRGAT
jgi:AcrR family transcriptional regulator